MQPTTEIAGDAHLGEKLDALLDGALPQAEEAEARAHLGACDGCRREYQRLSGAMAAVAGLGRARAPEGFAARVLKRVRSQRRSGLRRPGLDQKVPYEGGIVIILVAAAAAVLVAYGLHVHGGLFAKNEAPAKGAPSARP